MSLYDDFVADAGASAPNAASAPASSGLQAQFLADIAAPPAAPAAPAADPGFVAQLQHQLGLTARAGVTGVTALPALAGDLLNKGVNLGIHGVNAVTGSHIGDMQMPSQMIQQGENAAGFAQPQNATERIVQDATSSMAGVSPSVGLGKVLANAAGPTTQMVGRAFQQAPGMQMVGSAGSGAASSGANELGLSAPWQIGAGILGGTLGVLGGSLGTSALRAGANRFIPAPSVTAAQAATRADSGVDAAIRELGPQARQSFAPLENAPLDAGAPPPPGAPPTPPGAPPTNPTSPFGTFAPLKQQVATIIQQNPGVSPAAAMRAADFRNLGMQGTLGQITRDPSQYAQELNIRGGPVGAPLTNRFNQQNTQLQQALYGLAGDPANNYQAGTSFKSSLQNIDSQIKQQVSDAYATARASSGKNLEVPLTGLAQDYAQVLNDFDTAVPSAVRNNFNQLGLMSGTQQKTFSIENAENLLKVINANQSNEPSTNLALGQLRNSVKNAILTADDQGGVYAPARALAAQRFALHEAVPALEASANNTIQPDDFVKRYLIGGNTDETTALANLLKEHDPAMFQEARKQVGSRLSLQGFGANVPGDAPFKPGGYANAMLALGPDKLSAFYTPDELNTLNTIGRVGSYMNSFPSSAPVNTSNTASAIASMVGAGVKKIPVVGGLLENAQNKMFVSKALSGLLSNAPQTPQNLQPQGLLPRIYSPSGAP
jgi:hypothetical protein